MVNPTSDFFVGNNTKFVCYGYLWIKKLNYIRVVLIREYNFSNQRKINEWMNEWMNEMAGY